MACDPVTAAPMTRPVSRAGHRRRSRHGAQKSPREKPPMTSGAEASNPTTSSMPASSGSAMLKPLETSPDDDQPRREAALLAVRPQRLDRVDRARPRSRCRSGRRRCRPRASARSHGRIGRAQSVPPKGRPSVFFDDVGQAGPGGDVQRDELLLEGHHLVVRLGPRRDHRQRRGGLAGRQRRAGDLAAATSTRRRPGRSASACPPASTLPKAA